MLWCHCAWSAVCQEMSRLPRVCVCSKKLSRRLGLLVSGRTNLCQKVYTAVHINYTEFSVHVAKVCFREPCRSIRWPKRGRTATSRRCCGRRAAARGLSWRRQRTEAAALCAAGGGSASDSRTSVLQPEGLAQPPAGLRLRGRGWRAARDSPAGHGRAVARATPPNRARRG